MAASQPKNNTKTLKNGIHILFSALLTLLLSFSILRYITGTYLILMQSIIKEIDSNYF